MHTIHLNGPHEWAMVPIPTSTPDVQIVRLRVDPVSKASTSLVRFPSGWTRPTDAFYAVDEEIVVIEGELIVSGISYTEGQYGHIPAGSLRRMSATPAGALVLAHFSGIPAPLTLEASAIETVGPTLRLDLGSHHPGADLGAFGTGQRLRSTHDGECWLIGGEVATAGATEAIDIDRWTWTDLSIAHDPGSAVSAPLISVRTIVR